MQRILLKPRSLYRVQTIDQPFLKPFENESWNRFQLAKARQVPGIVERGVLAGEFQLVQRLLLIEFDDELTPHLCAKGFLQYEYVMHRYAKVDRFLPRYTVFHFSGDVGSGDVGSGDVGSAVES